MDRMGPAQIATTQKYLHTLPDADRKNLTALSKTRRQHSAPEPVNTGDTSTTARRERGT